MKLPYQNIAIWFQPLAIFQYGYFPIHHTPVKYNDKDVKSPLEILTEWTPHGGSTSLYILHPGHLEQHVWKILLVVNDPYIHLYSAEKALCFDE